MKLWLHHINHVSENVGRLQRFYAEIMGMGVQSEDLPQRESTRDYTGDVAFMRDDSEVQFHLAQKDLRLAYRTGKTVNPVERGHIAFRTDDIEAFKRHLEANDVPFSDFAGVATGSWHQIFFHDPEGNIIEVHQVLDD